MPVRTSRLPLRRVYLCAVRRNTRGRRLISQTRRNAMIVHTQIGIPKRSAAATLSKDSSQIMIAPRTTTRIVRETAAGVIQGLPIQIGVLDGSDVVDI